MNHEVSKVKCDLCGHEWIAVRPEGLVKLECPNCRNIVYFDNIVNHKEMLNINLQQELTFQREINEQLIVKQDQLLAKIQSLQQINQRLTAEVERQQSLIDKWISDEDDFQQKQNS